MKKIIYTITAVFVTMQLFAQQKQEMPDTTRFKLGKNTDVIVIEHPKNTDKIEEDSIKNTKKKDYEAHWDGVDFGFRTMLADNFSTNFDNNKYWENEIARSMVWNVNLLEHKFALSKQAVGITTGLGFSFTQFAFTSNYLIKNETNALYAVVDTKYNYSKNKLNAIYLTVPLLLEFCTKRDNSFYLAMGVVGGVRIFSRIKRDGAYDGKDFTERTRGDFGLNPFKLDGMIRFGYGSLGAFVSYGILSVYDKKKTVAVHPLEFGVTLNF
jgi:hypothetical protein